MDHNVTIEFKNVRTLTRQIYLALGIPQVRLEYNKNANTYSIEYFSKKLYNLFKTNYISLPTNFIDRYSRLKYKLKLIMELI